MGPLVSPLVTDLLLKYSDRNIFEYFIRRTGHVTRSRTRLLTTFRSCHLIVNRKLPDGCRYVCDFIEDDFFVGGFLLYFWNGLHVQTLTIFSRYYLHLGEKLNVSTASDSIFTVLFTILKVLID